MNKASDIAGLIQINEILYNFLNQLIVEKADLNGSFINILNQRAVDFMKNKNLLNGLLEGIAGRNMFAGKEYSNDWEMELEIQISTDDDAKMLELEHWVVEALEAYKTVLNTTSLTNHIKRSIVMDQKYFLQYFLLDLIKNRELNVCPQGTALFV